LKWKETYGTLKFEIKIKSYGKKIMNNRKQTIPFLDASVLIEERDCKAIKNGDSRILYFG
jgi:hypothetical protein